MLRRIIFIGLVMTGSSLQAVEVLKRLPDEYENTPGLGLALSNGGTASADAHAAIRINPALVALNKEYSLTAAYHWPTSGREFYQASLVDSKTSPLAAGVSYTGYFDDYLYPFEAETQELDSPIIRRGSAVLAHMFGKNAIGLGVTYVEANSVMSSEAYDRGQETSKGLGINLGLVGPITNSLQLGISAENLSNKRISEYVPRTLRAGVSYAYSPSVVVNLDYRQRDRVLEFEGERVGETDEEEPLSNAERMVIGSFRALLAPYFQLIGSYGQSVSDKRRTIGGGAALTSRNFTISYLINRPTFDEEYTHQAISISAQIAM